MTRLESMDQVDAAFEHLINYPDVLAELANGQRVMMVSQSGSMAFARPGDLTSGWEEIGRASDLLPFLQSIAEVSEDVRKLPKNSATRKRVVRLARLLFGLHRSYELIVDLHNGRMIDRNEARAAS